MPVGKRVERIEDWQEIVKDQEVILAKVSVKPGDIIEAITESKKRPGFVIVRGDNRDNVISKEMNFYNSLIEKIKLNSVSSL